MSEYEIPFHKPIRVDYPYFEYHFDKMNINGTLSNGRFVRELENAIKELYNVERVIACSSASMGLLITLQVFSKITRWEWEFYTPSFAWFSSKWAIETSDNRWIFQDIDKKTWLMKGQGLLHCALPVHTFGNIYQSKYKHTIYDGAHALGAKIKDFGLATIFSLAPTKLITSCEGGLILTNDLELADELYFLRDKVSRMSELNAIWGLETLKHLNEIIEWKRNCYYYYKRHLSKYGRFQEIPHYSNFATIGFLTDLKMPPEIEFRKYYVPLVSGFPNANYVYGKMVCLPSWFGVDYERITNRIIEFNESVDK